MNTMSAFMVSFIFHSFDKETSQTQVFFGALVWLIAGVPEVLNVHLYKSKPSKVLCGIGIILACIGMRNASPGNATFNNDIKIHWGRCPYCNSGQKKPARTDLQEAPFVAVLFLVKIRMTSAHTVRTACGILNV
jgi:hypothetical protein